MYLFEFSYLYLLYQRDFACKLGPRTTFFLLLKIEIKAKNVWTPHPKNIFIWPTYKIFKFYIPILRYGLVSGIVEHLACLLPTNELKHGRYYKCNLGNQNISDRIQCRGDLMVHFTPSNCNEWERAVTKNKYTKKE